MATRRRRRLAAASAATALALLAGCSSTGEPPPLEVARLPAVRLKVRGVEVPDAGPPLPASMNFIGRRRSERLAGDARAYLRERVQATGDGTEFGRATVEEASLIERPRATSGGMFSTEPTWEMVGTLAVRVAVVDGLGVEGASASSRVQLSRALSARTGVESKDNFARLLTNDLLAATGRELQRSVAQNLPGYLAP